MGVSIFMMLSGFVLAYTYMPQAEKGIIPKYMPWLHTTRGTMSKLNIDLPLIVEFAISLPLLVIVSIIVNRFFEIPVSHCLNSLLNRK